MSLIGRVRLEVRLKGDDSIGIIINLVFKSIGYFSFFLFCGSENILKRVLRCISNLSYYYFMLEGIRLGDLEEGNYINFPFERYDTIGNLTLKIYFNYL